jgi:uncharacterized protein YbjT (DUF2867 family)
LNTFNGEVVMKIVIPGGTGHIGTFLGRVLTAAGHRVVVVGRSGGVPWDGRTLGPWAKEIDGADVVVKARPSPMPRGRPPCGCR